MNTAMLHCPSPPSLPDELIFDILLLLPVSSLVQFKRVCKSWKTLISGPQFAYNHLHLQNPSLTHSRLFSSSLINHYQSKILSFPMKLLLEIPSKRIKPVEFKMEHKFRILGSCNGLLCLFDMDHGYVKLWNPSIGFKSTNSQTLHCFYKENLMKYYGFGYDHVNDKYKVVVSVCPPAHFSNHIYTFGENCWRIIHNAPNLYLGLGKFVSGTLNWVQKGVGSNHSVIISFDLEKETYKEVLLPENDGVKTYNHVLGVCGNCLCVCFEYNKTHLDFWLMKNYGVAESWTRMMKCEFPVGCLFGDYYNHLFILGNGIVVVMRDTGSSFLSNLNNGKLNLYLIWSELGWGRHIYHESLVAPKC